MQIVVKGNRSPLGSPAGGLSYTYWHSSFVTIGYFMLCLATTSFRKARMETRPSISELTKACPSGITLRRLSFLLNFQASRTKVTSVSRILRPVREACASDLSDLHSASLQPVILFKSLRGCRLGAAFLGGGGSGLAEDACGSAADGGGTRRDAPSIKASRSLEDTGPGLALPPTAGLATRLRASSSPCASACPPGEVCSDAGCPSGCPA
mmetsp:Transcript_42599/g.101879  ORF Transcript_42599/g.101879 Transcript_42599/m.101879 type:complete len:210 (-) Transcript_42599:872-1501(-)